MSRRAVHVWFAITAYLVGSLRVGTVAGVKILNHRFQTTDSFALLTTFCFAGTEQMELIDKRSNQTARISNKNGKEYEVFESGFTYEFVHKNTSEYGLAVYARGEDGFDGLWGEPLPGQDMVTCQDKVKTAQKAGNFFPFSSLKHTSISSSKMTPGYTYTYGSVGFTTSRPRWFYFVVTNCELTAPCVAASDRCSGPIDLNVTVTMTNGVGPYRHFSFDEFNILPVAGVFFTLYILFCLIASYMYVALTKQTKLHPTARILFASVAFSMLGFFFDVTRMSGFATTGIRSPEWELTSGIFHMTSDVLLVLVVMLVAKGYTIVRRKISAMGRVKIGVYTTFYFCAGLATTIWYHSVTFGDVEAVYIADSPPGVLRLGIRWASVFWFLYSCRTTTKIPAFRRKKKFYAVFSPLYILWLMTMPIAYFISDISPVHVRRGANYLTTSIMTCLGHAGLLYLFNPSKFNANFPFAFETREQELERTTRFRPGAVTTPGGSATNTTVGRTMEMTPYGPSYTTEPEARKSKTEFESNLGRAGKVRQTVSGGLQLETPKQNVQYLAGALRSKLHAVYEYADNLDIALKEFFDEEDDVDYPEESDPEKGTGR